MSTLVLLHGFGSSFDHNWQQTGWVDILADFGVTVPAIDLPGHGSSPPLTDPADYRDVDEEVRSALPADRPIAGVGFSAGAFNLLNHQNPSSIDTVDTSPTFGDVTADGDVTVEDASERARQRWGA